jgi:pyridoxal phosphate enzyme (YggS family)
MNELRERYEKVQERIAAASARANRNPADITLVAVTKTWPVETVLAAYEAGLRHVGENRVEELAEKVPTAAQILGPDHGLTWHLIGNLQSRKTGAAADLADFFHALDRLKIAQRLSAQCQANGRILPVLLELNVSGEESKAGFDVARWELDEGQREAVRNAAATIAQLPGLQLRGLMTMAPWEIPDEEIRAVFRRTRELARWLQIELPDLDFSTLSMGMTDDFEIAIEEGATHIRVGRALFGERQ